MCAKHCPPPSEGGRLAAAVIAAAVAAVAVHAVLGAIVWTAVSVAAVAAAAGAVMLRRELRRHRMSSRAELLSAVESVYGVGVDRRAIAARARPPRAALAARRVVQGVALPASGERIGTTRGPGDE